MAQVNKVDSNIVGLAFAEEAVLGLLPGEGGQGGTPVWNRLEPNSYSDFGGELITVSPNPINPSRQRKKGIGVDLNASAGFNHNLSFYNQLELLQAVMFADTREKGTELVVAVDVDTTNPDEYQVASTTGFVVGGLIRGVGFTNTANNALNEITAIVSDTSVEVADGQLVDEPSPPSGAFIKVVGVAGAAGDIDVDVSGSLPALTSTILDFTTLGLVEGQWIFVGGDTGSDQFANAENNGFKRVRSIAATVLTLDKSVSTMTTETPAGIIQIFFGDVLRNETGALIKRRSYNLERTLGAPDDAQLSEIQSEQVIGAIPSEWTINIPISELLNTDFTFLAIDSTQRDGPTGPKQTSVVQPFASDVFNTSSDFSRIKMASVSSVDEAPTSLFAFITEANITINNNLSVNKNIGSIGGFDVTAGTFSVSGTITAYFSNITAIQAVRNNSDITIDMAVVKENRGFVLDLPLISLGDGRLTVEQDQPITLPLSMDAATAEEIDSNLDYTAMFTFFHYLPTAAE